MYLSISSRGLGGYWLFFNRAMNVWWVIYNLDMQTPTHVLSWNLKTCSEICYNISGLHLELWGNEGFLTGNLKDGVILDIIDHASRWLGRYPVSLMNIWHDLAASLHLGDGGHEGFLTGDLNELVIFDMFKYCTPDVDVLHPEYATNMARDAIRQIFNFLWRLSLSL